MTLARFPHGEKRDWIGVPSGAWSRRLALMAEGAGLTALCLASMAAPGALVMQEWPVVIVCAAFGAAGLWLRDAGRDGRRLQGAAPGLKLNPYFIERKAP